MSSCKRASNTVTGKAQVLLLPDASVAAQVTVEVPTGKDEPEGGAQVIVTPEQLSPATICGKFTTVEVLPGRAVTAVMPGGQVMTGSSTSLTETVNEQPTPLLLEQFTVVVPTGKKVPDGGLQVTIRHELVVVGGG